MNWGNYDHVLRQLREAGLLVDDLVIGERVRVRVEDDREKRGWYHLHELPMPQQGSGSLIVGSFGVWRGNDNGAQKIKLKRSEELTPEQQAALKERIAADRKAAEAARKREIERAAARAQAMWNKLSPNGESEYLQRKGVAPHGVRFAESGAMVLPLLDVHGKVYGLQAIYPRGHEKIKRLGRDKDFWPTGLQKQGHFFLIGSPQSAGVCMIGEGYATSATGFEAMGLPVAIAFDAGNIPHVAAALRARWPKVRLLVLADDDYLGKCRGCRQLTPTAAPACVHCGAESPPNAGIAAAQATSLADDTSWLAPRFAADRPIDRKGATDWNDLHLAEGLHVVRSQLEAHLTALKWRSGRVSAPASASHGGGDAGRQREDLRSLVLVDQLHERYALVYEAAETVFDEHEHKLVPLASMRNLCASRQMHRAWMESADKRVVRIDEVGFDPAETDAGIKCNLWAGWPTRPRAGNCDRLLALGEYLCSLDPRAAEVWLWLQRWLAYPIQHPGTKMKTAIIMHGPQGTGKNVFFEAVLEIYGVYGMVVDQDTIEDKHNDFASRKLMLVADEVVARQEMFHQKNKLKGMVSGDWININPKFIARYRERNHVQIVFLSNETQPMALERDDRRYCVIWTPVKWPAEMYHAVLAEKLAGGVAALHDHLLNLELGDFGPGTLPPMTDAKVDLIELGKDSSERFWDDYVGGFLLLPVCAMRSEDLYQAYAHWCRLQGVGKAAQLNTCMGGWTKRPGCRKSRERHYLNHSHTRIVQSTILLPPTVDAPVSMMALSESINRFNEALKEWKELSGSDQARRPGGRGPASTPPPDAGGDDDRPF